ncbi:MAG: glycoside hydrolase family 2 protein, partial [Bacteroidales bacterium]
LFDNAGKNISHNVYWYSATNDFTAFNSITITKIIVKKIDNLETVNEKRWNFMVSNASDRIAFFINPRLISDDEEITPSFWSANYFTLAPGESMNITVGCPKEKISGNKLVLRIEGWNINTTETEL